MEFVKTLLEQQPMIALFLTIAIGYHDGYMRGLSNRAHVIVRGVYAPVVGRVSMDLTLIDVTDVPGVELHDQVTLLGWDRRHTELKIKAEELARLARGDQPTEQRA